MDMSLPSEKLVLYQKQGVSALPFESMVIRRRNYLLILNF
jgi:hypothetical protein